MTARDAMDRISEGTRKLRLWLRISGVAAVVLGALAFLFPIAATLAVELVFGGVLVASGLMLVARALIARQMDSLAWPLLFGALSVVAGAVLLLYPLEGVLALTMVIAVFFVLGGLAKLAGAWSLRPARRDALGLQGLHGWGWIALSGVGSILIGVILLLGRPITAMWILGILIGVDLVFFGMAEIMVAAALPPAVRGRS